MKEQKINVKLELTDGYEKRFTEAVCKVLMQRNTHLIPPDSIPVFAPEKENAGNQRYLA